MSNGHKRIDSLEKLRMEKSRLSDYCSYQEKLIGMKLEHFKANYPQILGDSLLPYDPSQNLRVGSLLDSVNDVIAKLIPGVFQGRFLPGMLLKLVEVLMVNLFSKAK